MPSTSTTPVRPGSNSRSRQGSGLGLAIVRQVAEQHGGSVSAANAPDGGAVFTLQLPTVQADGSETEKIREPVAAQPAPDAPS